MEAAFVETRNPRSRLHAIRDPMTIVRDMLRYDDICGSIFIWDMLQVFSDAEVEATRVHVASRTLAWMRLGMPRPDNIMVCDELSEMHWARGTWRFRAIELGDNHWRVARHSVPEGVMFLELRLPDDMLQLIDWLAVSGE